MTTKLLAVDDSKTMRKVLEITFAGNTYDSTIVGSADEAMAALRSNPPQLVVVDGHLGSANGYELCQRIKAASPQVKVMLLSSKQRPFDTAKAAQMGVDDHFDKPFDSTKFLDKLSQMEMSPAVAPSVAPPQAAAAPQVAAPVAAAPAVVAPQRAASQVMAAPVVPLAAPIASMAAAVAPMPVIAAPSGSRPAAPALSAAAQPGLTQSIPAGPFKSTGLTPSPSLVSGAPSAAASVNASPAIGNSKPSAALALNGGMSSKLADLGLSADQVQAVLALSREVVEQVVWEVVPQLAEALIKEEIARLTAE